MSDFDLVAEAVRRGRKFLITSHANPDGDSIGSELALYHLLARTGKEVQVINRDDTPAVFRFLPGSDDIRKPDAFEPPYDYTFVLDCGQIDRSGIILADAHDGLGRTVNIDHHVTSTAWADVNWIEPSSSSTAEMIYNLIVAVRRRPDLDMACCLYTGIITDTGSFRHRNTSSRVLSLAASLVKMGVDPATVATHVFDTVPYGTLKLLGTTLNTLGMTEDGLVAWITVTRRQLQETGTTWEATEDFINFPRSIPTVLVTILFKDLSDDEIKVSLRSRGRIDISRIALRHGGGGHLNAAGCNVKGRLDEVRDKMIHEVHLDLLRHLETADGSSPAGRRGDTPCA